MIHDTPESRAAIIHTAEGAWRCSACGGFVRRDARACKHCLRSFGPGEALTPPTAARTLLTLLGVGLIPIPFAFVGIFFAGYFWPGNGYELMGPPSVWLGGLAGFAIGAVAAFLVMVAALRSR